MLTLLNQLLLYSEAIVIQWEYMGKLTKILHHDYEEQAHRRPTRPNFGRVSVLTFKRDFKKGNWHWDPQFVVYQLKVKIHMPNDETSHFWVNAFLIP